MDNTCFYDDINYPSFQTILLKRGFIETITLALIFMLCQLLAVTFMASIDNKIIHFILDETLLYVLEYSAITVIGLKIQTFQFNEIIALVLRCSTALVVSRKYNNQTFDSQIYKYPPLFMYIIYGLLYPPYYGFQSLFFLQQLKDVYIHI